jgi:hypothetical protein
LKVSNRGCIYILENRPPAPPPTLRPGRISPDIILEEKWAKGEKKKGENVKEKKKRNDRGGNEVKV